MSTNRSSWVRRSAELGVLVVAVLLAGCSKTTKSGAETGTGVLTGYELGNPDDFADVRESRPDFQRYE